MVPKVAKRGTSFKGALAYYLHDKKQEGEIERTTSERVEWTATRGFYKDDVDPDLAGRIMAATAMDQQRLKRAAGVKNTGQKSKGAVYAYSIAWHPEEAEKLTKNEMLRAADESLREIGAGDRQAVIIAHNDEPQPHVHVIVNLVSAEDGRNLSLHADRNKLSAWGLAYRKERGEEHKYCPKRAERAEAAERRKEAIKAHIAECKKLGIEPDLSQHFDIDFVAGEKSRPRSSEKDFAQARAANDNAALSERDKQKAIDAALALAGRSQTERHGREWQDLDDRYKFKNTEIKTHAGGAIKRVKDQVHAQFRPTRTAQHREQYREKQFFDKREAKLFGKIENALFIIAHRRQIDPDGSRGFMAKRFNLPLTKKARAAALDKLHRVEIRTLGKQEREAVGAAKNAIQSDKSTLLSQAMKTFNVERTALIQRQAEENKDLQAKWKQRGEERNRAFDTVIRKARAKKMAKARPEVESQARKDFKKAAEGSKRRRSRRRGRSRKRTWD